MEDNPLPPELQKIRSMFKDRCHDFYFVCVMDDSEYSDWSNNSYAEGSITRELRNLAEIGNYIEIPEDDDEDFTSDQDTA